MTYETLEIGIDDRGVATVHLNLPEKRNALSAQMIADLTHMAQTLGADPEIRAIVLLGRGKVFCAGGDLDWMKAQINANRATRMVEARKLAMMLFALNEMRTPFIVGVHGGAFGGGVGLACVADVVIADTSAGFGLTETRLGLIPATISPYVIARMGEGRARRVFMSARIFGADEAETLGIVSRVAQPSDFAGMIEDEIAPYLSLAPGAVGAAKRLARRLGPVIDTDIIDQTIECLADTWETEEAAQGIEAFLTKTAPPWAR